MSNVALFECVTPGIKFSLREYIGLAHIFIHE